jgi:hypothetical protein
MEDDHTPTTTHPMGELSNLESNAQKPKESIEKIQCDTFAGLVHVEWDEQSPVTPIGQLVFFAQFLKTCQLFAPWVADCPLYYSSPNAPSKEDVLGTLLLAILSGQKRYAHITSIRQDAVNPALLGMKKVLSEDSARRAFQRIDSKECEKWQQKHLKKCYEPLLLEKWILDVDTTVKPLYGHQEGAEICYNPSKPGRPAHVIHTYSMAETRLILDSEVLPGNQQAAAYSLPRLVEIIEELPKEQRPSLIRGDCAFGNEKVLSPLEDLEVDYLFKVKLTKRAKILSQFMSKSSNSWVNAGQGWEGVESTLQLTGWTKERRVIILRRKLKEKKPKKKTKAEQLTFPFLAFVANSEEYEFAMLITTLETEIFTIAQLYRDRATSENHFDELKRQWGWGGFVTQDLKRSQIMARLIAQIYNWWTLFARWINPEKHAESITSRPLMLYGVAREINHAGQKTIKITPMHGKAKRNCEKVSFISSILNKIKGVAEHFSPTEIWKRVLSLIFIKFLKGRILGEGNWSEAWWKEDGQFISSGDPPKIAMG